MSATQAKLLHAIGRSSRVLSTPDASDICMAQIIQRPNPFIQKQFILNMLTLIGVKILIFDLADIILIAVVVC